MEIKICGWILRSFPQTIVIAQISTSSLQNSFGQFSWGFYNIGYNLNINSGEPIEFISKEVCNSNTIQIKVNLPTGPQFGLVEYPQNYAQIDGNGVYQVFTPSSKTLKSYKTGTQPCKSSIIFSVSSALLCFISFFILF